MRGTKTLISRVADQQPKTRSDESISGAKHNRDQRATRELIVGLVITCLKGKQGTKVINYE